MNGRRSMFGYLQSESVALVTLFVSLLAFAGCTRSQPRTFMDSQQSNSPEKENTELTCPEGDVPKIGSNNHKVMLSWDRSVSSSPPWTIRYCLYRTQDGPVKRLDGQLTTNQAPCKNCSRVNEVAVPEPHFTDLQVANGAHYCYVAVANQIGSPVFTDFSNQAQADVPLDPTPVPSLISTGKMCKVLEPARKKMARKH